MRVVVTGTCRATLSVTMRFVVTGTCSTTFSRTVRVTVTGTFLVTVYGTFLWTVYGTFSTWQVRTLRVTCTCSQTWRYLVTCRVFIVSASLHTTHFQPAGLETVWQVHGSKQHL